MKFLSLLVFFKPTMSVYNSKEKRILSWTALDAWAPSVRRKVAFSPAGNGSCQGCMETRGAPRKGIQYNDNEETTKEKKNKSNRNYMTATWKAIGQIIPDAKSSYKQIHEDDNLKAVEFHLFVFFWKFWEPCLRKVDPNLQCNWSFWEKNLYLK